MNLSNLTSAHFKQVISLLDKKEALQQQIAEIERQVASILGDVTGGGEPGRANRRSGAPNGAGDPSGMDSGTGKRGALKESIIAELRTAGENGISVKELSEKLNVKSVNLHAWFGSTGKKIEGLKKVGPAKYSLLSAE